MKEPGVWYEAWVGSNETMLSLIERIQRDAWNSALDHADAALTENECADILKLKRKAAAGTPQSETGQPQPVAAPSFESLHAALRHTNERVAALETDHVRKGEVGSYIIALRCEVLERVEKLEAATKNIALHTDEVLRAVRLNAGDGTSPSPSPALAPLTSREIGFPGINDCIEVLGDGETVARFYGPSAQSEADQYVASRAAVVTDEMVRVVRLNTGEGASTREGDVGALASDADPTPSPTSIPEWVPSEHEIAEFMRQANRRANGPVWYRPMSAELHAIRALIASRAPAAASETWRCVSCERRFDAATDTGPGPVIKCHDCSYRSAPAAPVVDVRRLLVDAGFCDEFGSPAPFRVQPMREALHAQNVRTVQP